MIATTTYKGFSIVHAPTATSKGVVMRFSVAGEGFNPDGYATMNNAKGAITKHTNAKNVAHDKGMEVLAGKWAEQDAAKSKAASSDDTAHASVPAPEQRKGRKLRCRKHKGSYVSDCA